MSPVVVAVGTFDGVHLGHRHLLATAHRLAAADGLELVALTLDRHPLALLHPERAPRLLTGLDHKRELLAAADGVVRVEVLRFDRDRADQSPESFLVDTIAGELGAGILVVGGNFRFGRAGAGDLGLARQVGEKVGLSVVGIPLVEASPGVVVSSSAIRRLVAAGHLDRAAALLGRPHEVRGHVRAGGSLPGELGGVTFGGVGVELVVAPELLLPPPGSYEARAGRLDGGSDGSPSLVRVRVVPTQGAPGALAVLLEPLPGEEALPWWASADDAAASVAFLAPAHPGAPSPGRAGVAAATEGAPPPPGSDGAGASVQGASTGPADR